MLKIPALEYDRLYTGFLSFSSCAEWCQFLANEAEFNDTGESEYWKAEAERFITILDKNSTGCSHHPKLVEAINKYVKS